MKLETVLNALAWSERLIVLEKHPRRSRQFRAFRDWLIRHDERQKMRIAELEHENAVMECELSQLLESEHALANPPGTPIRNNSYGVYYGDDLGE